MARMARSNSAIWAGNAEGDVDARAAEFRQRDDLVAGDAQRGRVPYGPGADECEGLGDVVAAGAHVGGAPDAERQRTKRNAVILEVAGEKVLGGAAAEFPGGGRGHGAGIHRIEVATGGKDVEPPARGGAGGA